MPQENVRINLSGYPDGSALRRSGSQIDPGRSHGVASSKSHEQSKPRHGRGKGSRQGDEGIDNALQGQVAARQKECDWGAGQDDDKSGTQSGAQADLEGLKHLRII